MSAPVLLTMSPRKRIEGGKVCCIGSHGQGMLPAASQAVDRFGYFFTSLTKTAGLLPFFPSAPPWYRQTQSSGSRFRFRFPSIAVRVSWQLLLHSSSRFCQVAQATSEFRAALGTDTAQDLSPLPRWPLNCPDVTYAIISQVEEIAHVSRRRVFPWAAV